MVDERLQKPWLSFAEPFSIYGNLYHIGTTLVCTHLIATEQGLVLIDPGYPQTLYLILSNIHKLGFSESDIRVIVCTHGHYDHLGAAKALQELCGAKICLGAGDRDYANGTLDLTWAKELGFEYHEAFEPDVLLCDGAVIELGSTRIECRAAAGHTPGTMAFFFEVAENGVTLRAGMHGGVGMNSMKKSFLDAYGLSYSTRESFPRNIDRLLEEKVDIHLGNHAVDNATFEKAAQKTPSHNPFIDPAEWPAFLLQKKEQYAALIRSETKRECE